jgi:ribulose-5-phosphate 4-epimerase/fuculose-1-phosphate aldolase
MKASDLIQVDHSGKVIDGGPNRMLNAAAFMIHSAIHTARPDVLCAAHSHSLHGRAFCSLGRPLDITTQDSCAFHNVSLIRFTDLVSIIPRTIRESIVNPTRSGPRCV